MPSNGSDSTPDDGITAPDALAAAMESINTLSVWLKDAGLEESAIAHFKYNALAKKFPGLADIIEDAKKLIGSSATNPQLRNKSKVSTMMSTPPPIWICWMRRLSGY
jgi:hypothetical protein